MKARTRLIDEGKKEIDLREEGTLLHVRMEEDGIRYLVSAGLPKELADELMHGVARVVDSWLKLHFDPWIRRNMK